MNFSEKLALGLVSCFVFSSLPSLSQANIILPRPELSGLRPYVFFDDNYWEVLNRNKKLGSQRPQVDGRVVEDPRDYLLVQEKVANNNITNSLQSDFAKNLVTSNLLPMLTPLLRADQGEEVAPLELMKSCAVKAVKFFEEKLPEIEKALVLPNGGPRVLSLLVAPWEKSPLNEGNQEIKYQRSQRFAHGQLGFSSLYSTPMRDYAAKYFLRDEEYGEVLNYGQMGNLLHRLNDQAQVSSAAVVGDENGVYQIPPFAYPLAFLLKMTIIPGKSRIEVEFLSGLHPMRMKMEPPTKNAQAEIGIVGIPQSGPIADDDPTLMYPMVLAHFQHQSREPLKEIKLNLQFGVSPTYHPFRKKLELMNQKGAWKMAPYLEGHALKAGFRIPIQIHLVSFDVLMAVENESVTVANLDTALNLTLPAGIKVGLADGKVVDQAGKEIQANMNAMIAQNVKTAKEKARTESTKLFPVAPLFMMGKKEN